MKKAYMVEWGTESSTGVIDDPIQWEFGNLDEALAFYNDIDLRRDWIREYNTSNGNSRHNVMAKQIIDCIDFDVDGNIEYGHILRFDEYCEAEYRAEEED